MYITQQNRKDFILIENYIYTNDILQVNKDMKSNISWNNHYYQGFQWSLFYSFLYFFIFVKAYDQGKTKAKQLSFDIVKHTNIYLFLKLPEEMKGFRQSFPE